LRTCEIEKQKIQLKEKIRRKLKERIRRMRSKKQKKTFVPTPMP
jgi:hypothetical protein